MKRVFCCLVAAIVLFGAVGCAESAVPDAPESTPEQTSAPAQTPYSDVVVFDDAALEALIRAAIGKPTGDITRAEAEALTELELSQQGVDPNQPYIHSLHALQYFPNLTYLGLGYAVQNADDPLSPVDISPVANLTNLQSLQMAGVVIDDLTALAGLKQLVSLTLFNGGQPLDLSPLAGLTNLQSLTLRNNQITDLSPLSGLTNLLYLDLEGNQITDVRPLANLTGLERLYLTDNPIVDYSPLAAVRADLLEWDFEVPKS